MYWTNHLFSVWVSPKAKIRGFRQQILEKVLVLIDILTPFANLGSTEDPGFQGGNTVVSQGTKDFTELDAYRASNCIELLLTVDQQAKTGTPFLPEVINENYHEA